MSDVPVSESDIRQREHEAWMVNMAARDALIAADIKTKEQQCALHVRDLELCEQFHAARLQTEAARQESALCEADYWRAKTRLLEAKGG